MTQKMVPQSKFMHILLTKTSSSGLEPGMPQESCKNFEFMAWSSDEHGEGSSSTTGALSPMDSPVPET